MIKYEVIFFPPPKTLLTSTAQRTHGTIMIYIWMDSPYMGIAGKNLKHQIGWNISEIYGPKVQKCENSTSIFSNTVRPSGMGLTAFDRDLNCLQKSPGWYMPLFCFYLEIFEVDVFACFLLFFYKFAVETYWNWLSKQWNKLIIIGRLVLLTLHVVANKQGPNRLRFGIESAGVWSRTPHFLVNTWPISVKFGT